MVVTILKQGLWWITSRLLLLGVQYRIRLAALAYCNYYYYILEICPWGGLHIYISSTYLIYSNIWHILPVCIKLVRGVVCIRHEGCVAYPRTIQCTVCLFFVYTVPVSSTDDVTTLGANIDTLAFHGSRFTLGCTELLRRVRCWLSRRVSEMVRSPREVLHEHANEFQQVSAHVKHAILVFSRGGSLWLVVWRKAGRKA